MTITEFKNSTIGPNIKIAFNNLFSKYPEYFSFANNISYQYSGTSSIASTDLEITLTNTTFSESTIIAMRDTFFEDAAEVVTKLKSEGKLTEEMTEKEKARILYEWIALHTEYDLTFSAESFTGYGALENQKAVCQGYTALYNLLCKNVGIEVEGISGLAGPTLEAHIWTIAILDGERVHIDTTFGDPVPNKADYCDFTYFARTSDFMSQNHQWDETIFGA